jgi:hypothetical protein
MTDLELASFLGIADDARWPRAIAKLSPQKRAEYEHLAKVCFEIELYDQGLGPRPSGVIICRDRKHDRR